MARRAASNLEETLALHLKAARLDGFEREHRFNPLRRWRFDFAYPDRKLAIECEGGTWVKGAHNRGGHFESDCEKYNAAALGGWFVLRYTMRMIEDGTALRQIEDYLNRKPF